MANRLKILVCSCNSGGARFFHEVCDEIKERLGCVTAVVVPDALRLISQESMTVPINTCTHGDLQNFMFQTGQSLPAMIAEWGEVLVIAPLDANTCAKISNGVSDDFVSLIAKAWDYEKPFFFAPDMHPLERKNPTTSINIAALEEFGAIQIVPDGNSSFMPSAEDLVGQIFVSLSAQGML